MDVPQNPVGISTGHQPVKPVPHGVLSTLIHSRYVREGSKCISGHHLWAGPLGLLEAPVTLQFRSGLSLRPVTVKAEVPGSNLHTSVTSQMIPLPLVSPSPSSLNFLCDLKHSQNSGAPRSLHRLCLCLEPSPFLL